MFLTFQKERKDNNFMHSKTTNCLKNKYETKNEKID